MQLHGNLNAIDLSIVVIALGLSFIVGCALARANTNSDTFFMAGRAMPGWAVGISLMATIVSSMTFLAIPAFSFKADWRWIATCIVYPVALMPAVLWFMPFYRNRQVKSAYEYLEQRFGLWARIYVAFGFVLMQVLRMGIILFATSLALEVILGLDSAVFICCIGVIVVVYCSLGGLKAVIWADVVQAIGLLMGGALVFPIVAANISGGVETVAREAISAGKTSLGPTSLEPHVLSFWAILISHLVIYMQMSCTDQMFVQRYCAPKSQADARGTLFIAMLATVPTWAYFIVMGTTLWAFYNHYSDPVVPTLSAEAVFPHFIATQIPRGLSGSVAAALCLAAMSTLSSSVNAVAATGEYDFYRRFLVRNAADRHYLVAGRLFSVMFGVLMIIVALVVRGTRTTTLIELQAIAFSISASGLLAIFLLGFATRTSNRAAASATILTIVLVITWLTLARMETVRTWWPHELWLCVVANVFLFLFALGWDFLRRVMHQ